MDIEITGGRIFYTFPFEIPILGKFQITETLVVSWLVMLLITGLCIWLTHDLKVEKISRRQAVAELNIINLRLDITHLYYPAKNSFQKGRLKRREIFTELLLYTLTT